MLFAAANYDVMIYDIDENQLSGAIAEIRNQIARLEQQKLLRGSLTPEQQFQNIRATGVLEECVKGASYIQVCMYVW